MTRRRWALVAAAAIAAALLGRRALHADADRDTASRAARSRAAPHAHAAAPRTPVRDLLAGAEPPVSTDGIPADVMQAPPPPDLPDLAPPVPPPDPQRAPPSMHNPGGVDGDRPPRPIVAPAE